MAIVAQNITGNEKTSQQLSGRRNNKTLPRKNYIETAEQRTQATSLGGGVGMHCR